MTTRRAAASRLALPILAASLLLAGCGDPWPESAEVERRMWSDCEVIGYQPYDVGCSLSWTDGYFDAQAAIDARGEITTNEINDGFRRQDTLSGSLAYKAGVEYARSVRP